MLKTYTNARARKFWENLKSGCSFPLHRSCRGHMIRGSSRPGPLGTVTKSEQKARRTRRVGAGKSNTVTNRRQKKTGTMVMEVKDTIEPEGFAKVVVSVQIKRSFHGRRHRGKNEHEIAIQFFKRAVNGHIEFLR